MIAEFNTSGGAGAAAGKGDNTILYVVLFAVAAFVVYKFVYVPYAEKKKAEQAKQ